MKLNLLQIWIYLYFLIIEITLMVKLACKDYGFECDFEVEGDASKVIEEFGKHTLEEHGIDYGKESLIQFILRKG